MAKLAPNRISLDNLLHNGFAERVYRLRVIRRTAPVIRLCPKFGDSGQVLIGQAVDTRTRGPMRVPEAMICPRVPDVLFR